MKNLIYKLLILSVFFAGSLPVVAGDTIRYTTQYVPGIIFGITATLDKQFTVRCIADNIEQTFTGIGEVQNVGLYGTVLDLKEIIIEGEEDCALTFLSCPATTIDLSKCPSIEDVYPLIASLKSINLSNCVNLKNYINIGRETERVPLKNIDLSDCKAFRWITCSWHELSVLDINLVNNPEIWDITCNQNYLRLSNLYALSELIEDAYHKKFARQLLGWRRVLLNDTLDYASEKEFGGITTNFYVLNGRHEDGRVANYNTPLADTSEYTIDNGVFTFHKAGRYTVDMRNPAVVQSPTWEREYPCRVILWVEVIDFVPVSEIINIPASATAGTQIPLLNLSKVVPENATYTRIIWDITDAGTTGATLTSGGIRLYTTDPGTVKIRATIEDGLAFDVPYIQDFVIEIVPLDINENTKLSEIKVYPNPTTGELLIENGELAINMIEILDIYGKNLLSHHLIISSPHHLINISHLPAGVYFVKMRTEAGKVIRKILKL